MTDESRRARAIGGIFFRSPDPERTRGWYHEHLGLDTDAWGTNFSWRHASDPEKPGFTQWAAFAEDTEYFGSRDQQFMINYRVEDLEGLLETLRARGVEVVGEMQREPYGLFAHIVDVDGRRIELWEPADDEYRKVIDGITD